jgi:hypothetical protein
VYLGNNVCVSNLKFSFWNRSIIFLEPRNSWYPRTSEDLGIQMCRPPFKNVPAEQSCCIIQHPHQSSSISSHNSRFTQTLQSKNQSSTIKTKTRITMKVYAAASVLLLSCLVVEGKKNHAKRILITTEEEYDAAMHSLRGEALALQKSGFPASNTNNDASQQSGRASGTRGVAERRRTKSEKSSKKDAVSHDPLILCCDIFLIFGSSTDVPSCTTEISLSKGFSFQKYQLRRVSRSRW